jgi:c-di-AMP phosphodiesterase-like protein
MKRNLIIIGSVVVVILLIIRMIVLQINRQDDRRKEYVSKLNYDFSARVDSVALFNPNAPVGFICFEVTTDSIAYRERRIARSMFGNSRRARFLDPVKENRFQMFSKDAKLYKVGDSLYVNSTEDKMRLFHDQQLVREFTISKEIRN